MRKGVLPCSMDCYDFVQQIDTFIDGELEISEHSSMEAHSAVCVDCNEKEARRRDTRQRLRATAEQFQPSADFMARLQTAISEKPAPAIGQGTALDAEGSGARTPVVQAQHNGGENAAADLAAVRELASKSPRPASTVVGMLSKRLKHVGLAAAALVAVGVGIQIMSPSDADNSRAMVAGSSSFASPVVGESVAWHRKSVPVEVVGPDAQTVRRWFADKVSFAVVVPELGSAARLLGGRLSHVRQYEAAYLLYEVNGSKLSVMLFDGGDLTADSDFRAETFVDNSSGYNVAIRERGGVTYTFTSDMNAETLAELVEGSMRD